MIDLNGRTAVVTGAGSGIGKASALKLAEAGAKIVAVDINGDSLEALLTELARQGGDGVMMRLDMSKEEDIAAMIHGAYEQTGRLDVVLSNTALQAANMAHLMSSDMWDQSMDLSLKSAFLAAKFALPYMMKAGQGVLLHTSSIHAMTAFSQYPAYAAAKAGLEGLTRQLAVEYGPYGIRVNSVAAGAIHTSRWEANESAIRRQEQLRGWIPLRRLGTAEEVANAVLFLAGDMATYVTGATLVVDGGITVTGR